MVDTRSMLQSILSNGLMRSNRFTVVIDFPQILTNDRRFTGLSGTTTQADLSLRINRITIPEMEMITTEATGTGSRETFPIARQRGSFAPLSFNVVLSEDGRERVYFERWIELMHGRSTGFTPLFYQNYVAPRAQVNILSEREGTIKIAYVFYNTFPTSVADIELSYDDSDAYGTCAITMQYERIQSYNF